MRDFYAVTEARLDGTPETFRTIDVADLRWVFNHAGPRYLQYYNKPKSDGATTHTRDESESGYGFRFIQKLKSFGLDYETARAAILAEKGSAGKWANRVDERQLERAWENSHTNLATKEETRPLVARSVDRVRAARGEMALVSVLSTGHDHDHLRRRRSRQDCVAVDMSARISKGHKWPQIGEEQECAPRGSVLILCKEDDVSLIIRPRLEVAGADLSRCHILGHDDPEDAKNFDPIERLDTTARQVEEQVRKIGDVKLIIIDPITDFVGKMNIFQDDQVRSLLNPLARLAARHDLAVVNVQHLNKKQDLSPRYRGIGSVAFRNVSRSTILIAKSDEQGSQRIMIQEKANLTPDKRAVAFSTEPVHGYPRIRWGTDWEEDVDVDDVLADKRTSKKQRGEKLLREWLADGPVTIDELQQKAEHAGIGWRTIVSAKKEIGVVSNKRKGRLRGSWTWSLPGGD